MDVWKLKYEDFWFVVKCYRDYVNEFFEVEEHEGMIPICFEEFYDNEYQELEQEYLCYLVEDFQYIDLTEDFERIDEDFYIWEKGTKVEDINMWFTERVDI